MDSNRVSNIKRLITFLIISFTVTTIIPTCMYIVYVFILHGVLSMDIAVLFMLLSFTTNMEIWILSIYTAITTYRSIENIQKEVDKYRSIADIFLGKEDTDKEWLS